ncbi:MAG: hypothetical protein JWR07_4045 [Nevskia sp.]|nr:hypothetical protein [Nevskia sp.]
MNKTIPALLFLLSLCGCADTSRAPQADIGKSNGYVYANFPQRQVGRITLKQVNGEATGYLKLDWSSEITTSGVWLPQGTYRLDGWEGSDGDAYPLVKVVAGRVTDLGSILSISVGNYQTVTLPVHHPEADKAIEGALVSLRPSLVSQQPIEWDPKVVPLPWTQGGPAHSNLGLVGDIVNGVVWEANRPSMEKQLRNAHQIDEFFHLAKLATPPQYRKPAAGAMDALYYGGGLGQIRVRRANGTWDAIDTGTLSRISAVRIAGGAWYAGAENGVVRQSLDQGRTWRIVASVAGNEPVLDVESSNGRLILVTEHLTHASNVIVADRLKLYTAPGNAAAAALLREIPLDGLPWPPSLSYAAQSFGNRLYIGASHDLYVLDLATLAWAKLVPPIAVTNFFVAPSSGLITAYHVGTFSSDLAISTDEGVTWQRHAALPSGHADVFFASLTDGRAVLWNAAAGSSSLQSMKYNATADQWTTDGEPVKGCGTVLHDPDFRRLGCVTSAGTILSYDGSRWVGEFSVE